jgi:hypothetical protein
VPLHSNDPKVDEAKEPNKIFQPFQISGDLSLFFSNDHQLCYLYKFWSITQMPMDEDNKKIVARSFGYIGHILTKD